VSDDEEDEEYVVLPPPAELFRVAWGRLCVRPTATALLAEERLRGPPENYGSGYIVPLKWAD
jgi:hypothetical protein